MYIIELTFPIFIMGWVFTLVQRGTASMQRIDDVLSEVPAIRDHADAQRRPRAVAARSSCAGSPSPTRASRAAGPRCATSRCTSRPARCVGIVGPVGAGKSTLASLIPRLYEVDDGMVFLDGVDVNRIPLRTLRSHIAMVPQDAFLFSLSLARQRRLRPAHDRPGASVSVAAERAQLAKDVRELPHGYDTIVGERGVMLSGGQRQRTALARALALDPKILILDDTLSAVDAETEAAIQQGLREVFRGRTVVVVASRVSTVRDADLIVVLDAGRLIEQGTPRGAGRAGGLYARLAHDQEAEERRRAAIARSGGDGVSQPAPPAARTGLEQILEEEALGKAIDRQAARAALAPREPLPLAGRRDAAAGRAAVPVRARARLDHQDGARPRLGRRRSRPARSAACWCRRRASRPSSGCRRCS